MSDNGISEQIRLTLVQCDLEWENKAVNLERIEHMISPLSGQSDIVVLPEMFTTGFSMRPELLAETMEGPTLRWMAAQAAQIDAALTGSFIVAESGQYFNRLVWMYPDGVYFTYDKRHCFRPAGEQEHYTPGTRQLLVEWKGWKIMPLICYDLRFPVWSRNTLCYDLLIYVANWPERRAYPWNALLRARAIENQSYTAGVNRVGTDGNGVAHSGDSTVVDFMGMPMQMAAQSSTVFTVSLSWSRQQEFRRNWPFWMDMDGFHLT
jgi:omega-amidase